MKDDLLDEIYCVNENVFQIFENNGNKIYICNVNNFIYI